MAVDPRLVRIIQSAYGHGEESESGLEMTAGDLEQAFYLAWDTLNDRQKQHVHDSIFDVHDDWSEYGKHIKVEE